MIADPSRIMAMLPGARYADLEEIVRHALARERRLEELGLAWREQTHQ